MLITVLLVWAVLSVPVGMLVGRVLARRDAASCQLCGGVVGRNTDHTIECTIANLMLHDLPPSPKHSGRFLWGRPQ
jgi:hypothetical protein